MAEDSEKHEYFLQGCAVAIAWFFHLVTMPWKARWIARIAQTLDSGIGLVKIDCRRKAAFENKSVNKEEIKQSSYFKPQVLLLTMPTDYLRSDSTSQNLTTEEHLRCAFTVPVNVYVLFCTWICWCGQCQVQICTLLIGLIGLIGHALRWTTVGDGFALSAPCP